MLRRHCGGRRLGGRMEGQSQDVWPGCLQVRQAWQGPAHALKFQRQHISTELGPGGGGGWYEL